MTDFYEGRKLIDSGYVAFDNQSASIYYTIFERWENILTSGAKCGAKETYRISRTIGFSREQKVQFDSAIKGSLGIQALLQFESTVSAQTSLQVRWSVEDKVEKEFEYAAPQCGAYIAVRYQLVREFELKYYVRSWFRERGWPMMVTERLEKFHDGSQIINYDPSCGCVNVPQKKSFDGLLLAEAEKFSFWIPFTIIQNELEVTIGRIRARIQPKGAARLILKLPTSYLPPDLLFLAQEERAEIVVILTLLEVREGIQLSPYVLRNQEDHAALNIRDRETILSPLLPESTAVTPQFRIRHIDDMTH